MTNDEFILEKKRNKFSQAWEKLNRLFDSRKEINVSNLTFHRRKIMGQVYVSCTSKGKPTILLNKGELEQSFINNKEYKQELNEAKRGLYDKKQEGYGVNFFPGEATIDKEILALVYEQRYIERLFVRCGCDLKVERRIDNLNLAEVGTYIRNQDESTLSAFYYEFKNYGLKKLKFVIKTKKNIENVLFGVRFADFRKYCMDQNIKTIKELLLFPYYSRVIVEKFGFETIQKIIQVITGTIDIILMDVGGTKLDLSDLI